jgi:dimethylargininase
LAAPLRSFNFIEVDPLEAAAANALLVGEMVLFPEAFPRTRERLQDHGLTVRTLDVSELAKAEGGLTCCSLLLALR